MKLSFENFNTWLLKTVKESKEYTVTGLAHAVWGVHYTNASRKLNRESVKVIDLPKIADYLGKELVVTLEDIEFNSTVKPIDHSSQTEHMTQVIALQSQVMSLQAKIIDLQNQLAETKPGDEKADD